MAFWIYVATAIVIPIIYILQAVIHFLWKHYKLRRFLINHFPIPDYEWFFGHIRLFPGMNEDGLEWRTRQVAKLPRYYVLLLGPLPILQLNHPETIKQLTNTAEGKQTSMGGAYRLLLPWIGSGLLVSSGRKWHRNRKLLTPAFHFDILKPYVKIYHDCVMKLLKTFESRSVLTKTSMDIYKPVGYCTLDIILQCAFSSRRDIQEKGDADLYAKTVSTLGRQVVDRIMQPLVHSDFIYYKTQEGKSFLRNSEISHNVADDVIRERKAALSQTDTQENLATKRYVDFLDILLLAKDENDEGLTDKEIRDEVETFMFEGHDTTASGIAWCLYNLARHPHIQARVQAEVDDILNARSADHFEWEDMSQLPYMTRCIKESMRLHTTIPFIGRELTQPLVIDDVTIPTGTFIDINLWNLHHNPQVWENPMIYDPDRFLPERFSKMDSHAFMPFSAGPRNCIGQNFAMNELKVTIGQVLRRFEITIDATKEAKMHPDLVLRCEDGIHLFFKDRQEMQK